MRSTLPMSTRVWVKGHQGGELEIVIGNWLKTHGKRNDVIIATKVGAPMGSGDKGLSRSWIMKECDASLKRLQTDVIDLYQAHRDDPETPQEETAQAFADLVKQGKVRALGASNFTAARLKSAVDVSHQHGWPRYELLQPLYNLVERPAFEDELEGLCASENIGVINYYALAAGFLTGKYRSEVDLGKEPAWRWREEVSERKRASGAEGARRRGSAAQGDPRSGRPGLADRAAQHNCTDRQRHQRRAVAGYREGNGTEAGCERHG